MANIFDLFKQISNTDNNSTKPISFIVVGLGNPGEKYSITRHNAGFMAIDAVAEKYGARIDRSRFKALCGECEIAGARVLLVKPQTFMNLSGEAVLESSRFYKIDAKNIIILSDDTSLDCGRLRVRRKGSAGGHNGLKSINDHLGTEEYPRIKIGVGQKPHRDYDLADWVLGTLNAGDLAKVRSTFDTVCQGLEKLITGDVDGAMQICNGSGK
jgi:PTH1 family peptidyl-tRNA hydrolase